MNHDRIGGMLDNIVWHTLTGPHAAYSSGTGTARRYAAGFTPIIAFADNRHPDFAGLRDHCAKGEHFYCGGWSGRAPDGWQLREDTTMLQMVWNGNVPLPASPDGPVPVRLQADHVPAMLELVAMTNPGPFGPRTFELGDYFGFFEGSRLVAMAGERMRAGVLREISAVCTHPDHQGRGYARTLVATLIRRQVERGELPFLHVMQANHGARELYRRMGFRRHQELPVRVVSR
jgi:GNAT superfamily N-acetyltransferase